MGLKRWFFAKVENAIVTVLDKMADTFDPPLNGVPDSEVPISYDEEVREREEMLAKRAAEQSVFPLAYEPTKHPEFRGTASEYQTHLQRHRQGVHENRFYDDCELCLSGTRPIVTDDWDDLRHSQQLGRYYDPDAPDVVEPSVPEGSTYVPTVDLPTRRAVACVERCTAEFTTCGRNGECVELQLGDGKVLEYDPEAKRLLEQIAPADESKMVRYPKPDDDASVKEWVDWRIGAGGLNPESLNRVAEGSGPLAGIRFEVRRGFSMSYLGEIVERAKRKDMTLTLDQLAAARSRGLI